MTDEAKEWAADHWAPGLVEVTSAWGPKVRRVEGNDADTLELVHAWTITPVVDDSYKVITMTTWVREAGIESDNENGDGETLLTWDLEEEE